MNKYYSIFSLIMSEGKPQNNKKGGIRNLTNQVLHLSPADLLNTFRLLQGKKDIKFALNV